MTDFVGEWTGEQEMAEIVEAITSNPPREHRMLPSAFAHLVTPTATQNPEPPSSGAPLLPSKVEEEGTRQPPPPALTPTPSGPAPPLLAASFVEPTATAAA
jgi:tRNA-dihydrouridine synthase 2